MRHDERVKEGVILPSCDALKGGLAKVLRAFLEGIGPGVYYAAIAVCVSQMEACFVSGGSSQRPT